MYSAAALCSAHLHCTVGFSTGSNSRQTNHWILPHRQCFIVNNPSTSLPSHSTSPSPKSYSPTQY
jgi:hypothetical protein